MFHYLKGKNRDGERRISARFPYAEKASLAKTKYGGGGGAGDGIKKGIVPINMGYSIANWIARAAVRNETLLRKF